ncbi:DUF2796 domain-containing protein [Pseudomonas sp. 2FG]|uniref:DUF2796 domain-containing protein n=1 Tax=Pseudomonas sp. 2FG TaxID=2502191 RepID=UPI0010F548CA|nr:DUF2796 domain-containing protein [Pseudomonas sp. 2FG]
MRRLLLALPFALLPLASAYAHGDEHQHEEHASLGKHEHGVAELNVVLDGQSLEIELESPAKNLLGFEHLAKSAADQAKVAAARAELEQPLSLFGLPVAAGCTVAKQELESPLFAEAKAERAGEIEHSEVHARYQLSCSAPAELKAVSLSGLFDKFPGTEKIQVQLIGPKGQQGIEATAANPTLSF